MMEYVVLFLVINLLQVKFNSILRSAARNLTINEGCFHSLIIPLLKENPPHKSLHPAMYFEDFNHIYQRNFGFSWACCQIIFSPWTWQLFIIKFDFLNLRKHSWKTFCPSQNFSFCQHFIINIFVVVAQIQPSRGDSIIHMHAWSLCLLY